MSTRRALAPLCVAVLAALTAPGCGGPAAGSAAHASPEEVLSYAISRIVVPVPNENPSVAMRTVLDALDEIRGGRSFADIARARSAEAETAGLGGFAGFVRPRTEDVMAGAVQALVPGVVAGPVQAQGSFMLLMRHSLEEGRRLEAACTIPAYGFFVPVGGAGGPEPRQREAARQMAEHLLEQVRAGPTTLAEAAQQVLGDRVAAPDAFWGLVRNVGPTQPLYEALARVKEGEYLPVAEHPPGFAVLKRGRLFRIGVRHILVHHINTPSRGLSVRRLPEEARSIAEKALQQARPDGSNWAELVQRYSDDTFSVPLAGSIGVVANGDIDPRLEEVLLETAPGHVGARVAESEQGFHVLYRVD